VSHGVEVCQTGGQRTFALRTPTGQFLTAAVSTQAWNQRVKANTDWSQWVAALSGTMGPRTEKGFTLVTPGLQVFETRAKVADATPLKDTLPPPRRSLSPRRTPPHP